ncbi:LemA family protein [Candidatus Magnetomonas plexicatena]|uniref:LemA family protein n=1 Tax=Candidatus Magnetomonas plexicatena TaxID=2552947 RepID=UPI001C790664|nr:LemA family protein [Nitrospirales bacterium LBB_01]
MITKKIKTKYLTAKYILALAGIILLYKSLVHAFIYNQLVDEEHIYDISANNLRVEEERRIRVLESAGNAANTYMETENKLFNIMIELNGLIRSGTNYAAQEHAKSEVVRLLSELSYLRERSPELMAKGPFLYLMDIMTKTEARIANARRLYNVAVYEYNDYIYLFPFNIFARGLGFHEKQFYKAEEGAEHVPVVD